MIMVSREIRECRAKLDSYVSEVSSRFDDYASQVDIRSDGMKRHMNERLDSLPVEIVDIIKSQLLIEGAIPVISFDVERIVREKLSAVFEAPGGKLDQINIALERISQQQADGVLQHHFLSASSNDIGATGALITYTGDIHHWPGVDDKIHIVPLGFTWPSYNATTMWNLWFLGDANKRICPFRSISPKIDLISQK